MSQEKDLHPITRKEKILDGQDLAPVTRLEYFLKKAATKGEGGGGVQIIRPLKIKDLPPVPQGLTPKVQYYDMTDSESEAPVFFLHDGTIKSEYIPVVTNSGSDVVYTQSCFEINIEDAQLLIPTAIAGGVPVNARKAPDYEGSNVAVITADVLQIQLFPMAAKGIPNIEELAAIDVSTIQWVGFNDK